MTLPTVTILGVRIHAITRAQVLETLREMTRSPKQHHVITPNPEMLVTARHDDRFRQVLSRSALNVPDGTGLLYAAAFSGQRIPERVTGTDLVSAMAGDPAFQPIFFLGAAEGVALRASAVLSRQYPSLVVAGTYAGSPAVGEQHDLVRRITESGARTLFVAFGAPNQDLWIDDVLPRLSAVRIAMGVGGAFDFFAGVRKRAPRWMQRLGFEWLYRLLQEPSRFRRILTAVIVFPLLALLHRRADIQVALATTRHG